VETVLIDSQLKIYVQIKRL